jgi:formylmethanofuran dehydrogenase subunit E
MIVLGSQELSARWRSMVVSTLFMIAVAFRRVRLRAGASPARKCAACGEWFVVPNERETMCYYCIAGEMQEEMES